MMWKVQVVVVVILQQHDVPYYQKSLAICQLILQELNLWCIHPEIEFHKERSILIIEKSINVQVIRIQEYLLMGSNPLLK